MTAFAERIAALSREFAFSCDGEGVITWADDRAGRTIGAAPGVSLRALAAPGSEDKVDRLLAGTARTGHEARGHRVWEVVFGATFGEASTAQLRAEPHEGGLLVVGSVVSADVDSLLTRMGETMSELAGLHRERERSQSELQRLNREIAESGRGMAALYEELDESKTSLQVAADTRDRFVSTMSHELRTPLSSIIGLTKLLLSRIDGDLTSEQEKQIGFIRKSADELLELVNDLLDLSKVEAGKLRLRPSLTSVDDLFSTLRGQLRALTVGNPRVRLVFEDVPDVPVLRTDEGKIAQVLRNLVSNALKFTERGEVRVSARRGGENAVVFEVCDTGVGIAKEDLERVFEEFAQIDNPLQKRAKGTGLGLNLSRRLARLLGGDLTVRSTLGAGSTFTLTVPAIHPEAIEIDRMEERGHRLQPGRSPVLVLEDDPQTLFLYERYLAGSGFQVVPARSVEQARVLLQTIRPAAMVLDVFLDGETSWQFLSEMKRDPKTCDIPTLVVTVMDRERKARALGADEFYVKPIDKDWLLRKLRSISSKGPAEKVLVIDDDEVARYLLRRLLSDTDYQLLEADDGVEGVKLAREFVPDVIFLDFVLPSMTAFEVLDELKSDPTTRSIPVIVSTSRQLDAHERERLAQGTVAIVTKDKLSREVAITRIREALTQVIGAQAPQHAGATS